MTEHEHQDHHHLDRGTTRGFVVAITLIAEVAGGIWTNSLALLSDAAHSFHGHIRLNLPLAAIHLIAASSLHVWSTCSHITVLSAHIDIEPDFRLRQSEIIGNLEQMLDHDYYITHTTLQAECSICTTGPVIQQLHHRPRKNGNNHSL